MLQTVAGHFKAAAAAAAAVHALRMLSRSLSFFFRSKYTHRTCAQSSADIIGTGYRL